jgi:hypothetical protein
MLITPVANVKSPPPTSSTRLSRSSPCASDRIGGFSNSFGMTVHSFASRIGIAATPLTTCSPWVAAYSQLGLVGQPKPNTSKPFPGPVPPKIAFESSRGW